MVENDILDRNHKSCQSIATVLSKVLQQSLFSEGRPPMRSNYIYIVSLTCIASFEIVVGKYHQNERFPRSILQFYELYHSYS